MPDDSKIIGSIIAGTLAAVAAVGYTAYRFLNVLFISRAERQTELKQKGEDRDSDLKQLGEKIDKLVTIATIVQKDLEQINRSVDQRFEHMNATMQSDHARLTSEMLRLDGEMNELDRMIRGDGKLGSGVLTYLDTLEQRVKAAWKAIEELRASLPRRGA